MPEYAKLTIMTNGFWLKDPDQAYVIIRDLDGFDVDKIEIKGFDKFHRERALHVQGWDCSEMLPNPAESEVVVSALERLASEVRHKNIIKISASSYNLGEPKPFGRAANMPNDEVHKYSTCEIPENLSRRNIGIDPKGNVHLCCWEIAPPIGSAIDRKIEDLIDNRSSDPISNALFQGNIGRVASLLGQYEIQSYFDRDTQSCLLCKELFSER